MAQKKITDLQLIDEVVDDLSIPGDDGIQSYRATALQMKNYVLPDGAITSAKMNKTAVSGQTEDASPLQADAILSYDASADALKKVTLSNIARLMKARNYADNSEFRFFQRQTPGTLTTQSDAAYGPDRWKLLTSHTTNVQAARVAGDISSSPSPYACQLRQADSTARQIGMVQYLESDDVLPLRGKTVTFSFWAKTDSTEITAIRAGIIEWTSTADTITSDPVSSWSGTPTLVSNMAFKNTPADLTVSSTWAQFSITVTLGSTFNNLGLMIWTPNTEAQNDDLYISQVQLVDYDEAIPWSLIRRDYAQDLEKCQRFYEKSYNVDVAPGTATTVGAIGHGPVTTGQWVYHNIAFAKQKRTTPSFAWYDCAGTASRFSVRAQSNDNQGDGGNYSVQQGALGASRLAHGVVSGGASTNLLYHFAVAAEL